MSPMYWQTSDKLFPFSFLHQTRGADFPNASRPRLSEVRFAAAKEDLSRNGFFAMDIEATGVTRATAGAATICFERYGEERVYHAFVHPQQDHRGKSMVANQKDIEEIASCLMQPDVPEDEDDLSEKVREACCFAEMEEDMESSRGYARRAQSGRGRGQRRKGKGDNFSSSSGPLDSTNTAGILKDILQTNFGAIQDRIQSTNW